MALIAIYDSGVGGLSVFQKVAAKCPRHDYLFLSDTEAFPYGTKSEKELLERSRDVIQRLEEDYSPDVLIVACNTASTVVLPTLRDAFDFHVIGVVPAIKPAAELSKTGRIAVLATPATVDRSYTHELIAEFASHCDVQLFGSSALVQLAEDKLYGRPLDYVKIATILEPIFTDSEIDVIVLACTHFPLLKDEVLPLLENLNRKVHLVDSGEAIANRLSSICQSFELPVSQNAVCVAVTTSAQVEPELIEHLGQIGFSKVQHLVI